MHELSIFVDESGDFGKYAKLDPEYAESRGKYSKSVYRLAGIEVLRHNRTALAQMLENENRQRQRAVEQTRAQEQVQTPKKKKDRGMSL